MSQRIDPPFRADQVGSLLRPPELIALRERHEAGEVTDEELHAFEDKSIRDIVAMQEEIGLKGVTDGEFRRASFTHDFLKRIGGVEFRQTAPMRSPEELRNREKRMPPFMAVITGKLSHPANGIEVENFRFLKSVVTQTAKLAIPSPTMTHFRGGRDAIDKDAYPDIDSFFADIASVYRAEIAMLADAGCTYLQMDDTNLAYLCDPKMRDNARRLGEDPDQLPKTYAKLINECISDRPADMKVCIHLCRGNASSSWFAEGGYEPIAEDMFNLTEVDGFFLEYDDERSGDFAPLRFVPKGKTIVLGLVSSKFGALEDIETLKRRVGEAAGFLDQDQLCLSPQCGFSSSTRGANKITLEEEKAKLRLVVEAAEEIWN